MEKRWPAGPGSSREGGFAGRICGAWPGLRGTRRAGFTPGAVPGATRRESMHLPGGPRAGFSHIDHGPRGPGHASRHSAQARAALSPFVLLVIPGCQRSSAAIAHQGFPIRPAVQVGKYRISPIVRHHHGDGYQASVSIRSGRGSMTHDRVLRFVPVFGTRDQATRFATEQALAWIGGASRDTSPVSAPLLSPSPLGVPCPRKN